MFRISKEFHLSYSHQLHGLRDGHPCGRIHGHNGIVRVELEAAQVGGDGFVVDYGDLKPLGDMIDAKLDHRHLNDVVMFQPSAENLAKWLFDWVRLMHREWPVVAVAWSETPKTWAIYTP